MLGLLLARAGREVVVLEKHADFLRDFRGDTIHPSTLEILDELGLAERLLRLPHSRVTQLAAEGPDGPLFSLTLERLPTRFPFIALIPQWDFLDFVTAEAGRYRGFHLTMNATVESLLEEDGVVRGVRWRGGAGLHTVRASLTVGADGRGSLTRAGLPLVETSPPMDVLWFRLPRRPDEPESVALRLGAGKLLALINRREYWQIAYVIPKGAAESVRAGGVAALRAAVAELAPSLADRTAQLTDWDQQVKLLTVRADRLRRWHRPGYLAIGDAAHAMSPIGGVGINVAIQDAVMAANLLWKPLRKGAPSPRVLAEVERRRRFPVRLTQRAQGLMQEHLIQPALAGATPSLPLLMRAALRVPVLRDLFPRLIALGVRRPHVKVPAGADDGRPPRPRLDLTGEPAQQAT